MKRSPNKTTSKFTTFKNARDGRRGFNADWYRELTPSIMAEGFKRSADIIVENRFETSPQGDLAFWPAVFLYRHAIELLLKEVIRHDSRLRRRPIDNKILGSHALEPLWASARPLLNKSGSGQLFQVVNEVVTDLHAVDPRGEAFRYYQSKSGGKYLMELPSGTSLEYFADKASQCVMVLDGSLTEIFESMAVNDEMREYWSDSTPSPSTAAINRTTSSSVV